MATRFYLSSTASADITPAYSGIWNYVTDAVRRECKTSKTASAMTGFTTILNNASEKRGLAVQFVSDPLIAQTISTSATIKGQVKKRISNAGGTAYSYVVVKLVNNVGTLVAELYSGSGASPVAITTSSTNRKTPTSVTQTGGSISVSEGDRIVIEIGDRILIAGGGGSNYTLTDYFGDNSATDLGENNTDTFEYNSWIELSQTLNFLTNQTITPSVNIISIAKQTPTVGILTTIAAPLKSLAFSLLAATAIVATPQTVSANLFNVTSSTNAVVIITNSKLYPLTNSMSFGIIPPTIDSTSSNVLFVPNSISLSFVFKSYVETIYPSAVTPLITGHLPIIKNTIIGSTAIGLFETPIGIIKTDWLHIVVNTINLALSTISPTIIQNTIFACSEELIVSSILHSVETKTGWTYINEVLTTLITQNSSAVYLQNPITVVEALEKNRLKPIYFVEITLKNGGGTVYFSNTSKTYSGQKYENYIAEIIGLSETVDRMDSSFLNPDIVIQFLNDRWRSYLYLVQVSDVYPFEGASVIIKQSYLGYDDEISQVKTLFVGILDQPENIDLLYFSCKVSNKIINKNLSWKQDDINLTDFPSAYEDLGKIIPHIYGGDTVYPLLIPALRTNWGARTTIMSNITLSASIFVELTDSSKFPSSGQAWINGEKIGYAKTGTGITINTRGMSGGIVASAHSKNSEIVEHKTYYESVLCKTPASAGNIYAEIGGELLRIISGVSVSEVGDNIVLSAGSMITVAVSDITINSTLDVYDPTSVASTLDVYDPTSVASTLDVYDPITIVDTIGVIDTIDVNDGISITNPTHLHAYTENKEQFASSLPNPIRLVGGSFGTTGSGYIYFPSTPNKIGSQNITVTYRAWIPLGIINQQYASIYAQAVYNAATALDIPSPLQISTSSTVDSFSVYASTGPIPPGSIYTSIYMYFDIYSAKRTISYNTNVVAAAQATARAGIASKTGSATKTGSARKSGTVTKTGTVTKSGTVTKTGTVRKSGTVTKTGTVTVGGSGIKTYTVDRFHAIVSNGLYNSAYVLKDFLSVKLGYAENEIDNTSFALANLEAPSMAFVIDSKITPSEFLQSVAFEGRCVLRNIIGVWYCDYIPNSSPASIITLTENDIAGEYGKFTFSKTPIRDIINDVSANCAKNYSTIKTESQWNNTVKISDSASQTKYGIYTASYDLRYIKSTTAAINFLNGIILQRKVPLLRITFSIFWNHFVLKIGDTFTITYDLYNGKKFYIESIKKIDEFRAEVSAIEWY